MSRLERRTPMNFNDFINQKIINKKDEEGVVISFDKERIIIKYDECEKSYNPDVALKNGFITFIDSSYQEKINRYLVLVDDETKKNEELVAKNDRIAYKRSKDVLKKHERLVKKAYILRAMFGQDFIYPPLLEFERKYHNLFIKDDYSVTRLHAAINARY